MEENAINKDSYWKNVDITFAENLRQINA